jgi:hypothetical protein
LEKYTLNTAPKGKLHAGEEGKAMIKGITCYKFKQNCGDRTTILIIPFTNVPENKPNNSP